MPDPRPVPVPRSILRDAIPAHVAIVMDGNGRWAARRGLARTEGHGAGEKALVDVTYGAIALGVKVLTVYAFSTENWRRPIDEVRYLMNFNQGLLERNRDDLHDQGVRITFSGREDRRIPRRVLRDMHDAEDLTLKNKVMTLNIAFNYGGRAEILDAAARFKGGGEEEFRACLYAPDMHDPDLIIRTSGERRLSNYLLWQSAYSELVFREELWPDFTREAFEQSLGEFSERRRRYGGR